LSLDVKLFSLLGAGRPREIIDHVFGEGRHVFRIVGERKSTSGGQMCGVGTEDRFIGIELHQSREREGLSEKIDGGVCW